VLALHRLTERKASHGIESHENLGRITIDSVQGIKCRSTVHSSTVRKRSQKCGNHCKKSGAPQIQRTGNQGTEIKVQTNGERGQKEGFDFDTQRCAEPSGHRKWVQKLVSAPKK
jgi:hypothetical protein